MNMHATALDKFVTTQVGVEDGTNFAVIGVAVLAPSEILTTNAQGSGPNINTREPVGPEVVNGTAPRGMLVVPPGRSSIETQVSAVLNTWLQIYVGNKAH